jgi:hypothetical protein
MRKNKVACRKRESCNMHGGVVSKWKNPYRINIYFNEGE